MQQAGHCKRPNLTESGQMSRRQEQISARSRDNHLMTRRRYISVEELIWRELGEFLPKDAFHDANTRSSNTEKSLRLTTSCILGRLASRKNKGDFSASRTLSRACPSPSLLFFLFLLSRQEPSCPGITTRMDSLKLLARVNLTKRPRGKSIDVVTSSSQHNKM